MAVMVRLTVLICLLQYWRVGFEEYRDFLPLGQVAPSESAHDDMQRPDEKKRQLIAEAAARLFATRPFHKVKLDDVAAEAGVGKGTLYVYFKSKEDLYFWLIYDAFSQVIEQLESQLGHGEQSASQTLRRIITELVKFSFDNPQLFELMRSVGPRIKDERWETKRKELVSLIEKTIRRGNRSGEFDDPYPEITALCLPGFMRSVILFGTRGLDQATVTAQLTRLVERGVRGGGGGERKDKDKDNGKRNVAVATGRNGR
jgi:AcrR family transcriptional regulator